MQLQHQRNAAQGHRRHNAPAQAPVQQRQQHDHQGQHAEQGVLSYRRGFTDLPSAWKLALYPPPYAAQTVDLLQDQRHRLVAGRTDHADAQRLERRRMCSISSLVTLPGGPRQQPLRPGPRSSILDPRSRSSILDPRSSILDPRSSCPPCARQIDAGRPGADQDHLVVPAESQLHRLQQRFDRFVNSSSTSASRTKSSIVAAPAHGLDHARPSTGSFSGAATQRRSRS